MRGTFGLEAFRPEQRNASEAVVSGRDTVAIMPTGAGKSPATSCPRCTCPARRSSSRR
jgi:ATP-dependent DNA helicase RecQ